MACLGVIGDGDGCFCELLLNSVQVTPCTFLSCLMSQGICVPPMSDLQLCLCVSSGENSGDIVTELKWYKNPLKSSLGNTLFHTLADENSPSSTSSYPIYTAFLQASSHCSRVMPVGPKIFACKETCSLFSKWKWSEEWVWLTFHAQAH